MQLLVPPIINILGRGMWERERREKRYKEDKGEGEKRGRERHTLSATLSDQCLGKSPATSILSPASASITFSVMSSPVSIC